MIEMGLKRLNDCGYICTLMRFAILALELETGRSYFANLFAKQYVR